MRIVLLGAPGSGKGTQAAILSRRLGLAHVASGDLFRQKSSTELGAIARSYMEKGLLVPDEVTVKMILERIAAPDCAKGFILDGFPRTLEQAEALDKALADQGETIDRVLYIKVSTEELLRRLSGRLICRNCQAPYHLTEAPPKMLGRCDRCGGELYQRADDSVQTTQKRIEVYLAQTTPLIDFYQKMGKLATINGAQDISGVTEALVGAID